VIRISFYHLPGGFDQDLKQINTRLQIFFWSSYRLGQAGWGREPWEWGASVNDDHLRVTPVPNPTVELWKDKSEHSEGQEKTRPGTFMLAFYYVYVYMRQSTMRGCHSTFFLMFVCFWIKVCLTFASSFPEHKPYYIDKIPHLLQQLFTYFAIMEFLKS
jgi:hypothetical protein